MPTLSRRTWLQATAAGVGAFSTPPLFAAPSKQTDFRLACMTLPFQKFTTAEALAAVKQAGFAYVAWGTTHRGSDGKSVPILASDASLDDARALGQSTRDAGLEPLLMFSGIYPEHKNGLEVLTRRLQQAAAAKVPQVLTFGHTEGGNHEIWIDRFRKLGPIARDLGVLLVVKQHGGTTGTGEACAKIVREVNDAGVWVNYDAGNVMDYLNVDPQPDIRKCADVVRSFCLKDHRNTPTDEDCAPGTGEIDHLKLLAPVAWTGLTMPLCFENIFEPGVPRPSALDDVTALARKARLYMEKVLAQLQELPPEGEQGR